MDAHLCWAGQRNGVIDAAVGALEHTDSRFEAARTALSRGGMAVDGYPPVGNRLAGVERMRRFDDESAFMSAGSSLSRTLAQCNHVATIVLPSVSVLRLILRLLLSNLLMVLDNGSSFCASGCR